MSLSRSEEMHRLTENVYKTIMEQFNPSLRNFIAMGKNYEKALAGVTYAAKGYFDALVKMGELASESQGSKELGDVLFQMAEVHRQIQNQLEEMLKSFHNELLTQLEQKVELDSRYLSAALKKYQTEQRSKGDALDKCQAELKKLRKKSQGSKNPQKYSDKELQYIDAISNKQGELENYVSDGYKTALTEERRRFCFLVEKQCAVAKNSAAYHSKGKELLAQKLPLWQQACADPNKIPDRAVQLMQQMANSNGSILPSTLSASKSNLVISDPIPGAWPLGRQGDKLPGEVCGSPSASLPRQSQLWGRKRQLQEQTPLLWTDPHQAYWGPTSPSCATKVYKGQCGEKGHSLLHPTPRGQEGLLCPPQAELAAGSPPSMAMPAPAQSFICRPQRKHTQHEGFFFLSLI
uniref:BAR/IMD domain containing adaptor protein 2 n=1 Tax=Equus asinus TaxID=9793 RepID=A0A9L0K7J5_EQUAS